MSEGRKPLYISTGSLVVKTVRRKDRGEFEAHTVAEH